METDPFREERHYSRFVLFYGLLLVGLVALGFVIYHFGYRDRAPLDAENEAIREEIERSLDEE